MDRRPEVLTEQNRLLDIQFSIKDKTRILDLVSVILAAVFILSFGIAIFVLPKKEFSEQENRYLQTLPNITLKRLLTDNKTSEEIGEFYADQFPMRDIFVGIKSMGELGQLKAENNGVVLGKRGYIIKRGDHPSRETIANNLSSAALFGKRMEELGVGFTAAIAGRSVDVLHKYLPPVYPRDLSDDIWEFVGECADEFPEGSYVNLRAELKTLIDGGEPLYYRTDHHWTTLGAFYGYSAIAAKLGYGASVKLSDYTVSTASDSFYGTTWSSSGMKWIKPDTIEFFDYEGSKDYRVEIADTGEIIEGFYDLSYLDVKDKYSVFIGGNNARVDVYKADASGKRIPGRETMIVIKDSFAHALAPFLAREYDLVLIDLRYYKKSVRELVAETGAAETLIMMNLDSLAESNVLSILRLKLDE